MATAPKERLFGLLRRLGNAGLPDEDGDRLTLKKIGTAFASLPRVLGLVYRIQPFFTVALGVLYILQGFLPALTAFISAQLIQSVVTRDLQAWRRRHRRAGRLVRRRAVRRAGAFEPALYRSQHLPATAAREDLVLQCNCR